VVLGCVAFLLNLLIKRLAETELLTPAWAIIIILIIATAGWFGWPVVSSMSPVDAIERGLHYERILPRQAVKFLEWAGQHGWAQRVLTPRDPSESRELALRGNAEVSIVVTPSQRTLRVGQRVTFTATLTFLAPPAAGMSKTVEFYDGSASMGRAAFSLSGETGVASVTSAALTTGIHWITARYARTLLFGSVTSPPVTVTVTP
jgi:hypothetical protein